MKSLLILIIIFSGILTTILFFVVAIMARKIGGESDDDGRFKTLSIPFFSPILDLFYSCLDSIFAGFIRGEFRKPEEKKILITFLISFLIFIGSIAFLAFLFFTS